MPGNSIEAKLIIAANAAEAIKALQAVRREAKAAQADLAGTGGNATRAGTGAAAARQAAQQTAAATNQAAAATNAQAAAIRKANADRIRQEQLVAREVRASTNQQKQAYRQLPAQITDITTSIASGMPLWLVAVQQVGQIKDSFGGMGATARALTGLLTPLRVVVGGVAAVLATLGVAAIAGARESDRLNKTLARTGNVAGTSLGQINALSASIAKAQKAAIGDVRETLAALLDTGNYTSATLESAGRAVSALRKLTGQSADEAVADFQAQGDGILAWSLKANRAYNFLTAAQIAYVRQLQATGREQEAMKLVNEELAATLQQRAVPAVGFFERAWGSVLSVLSQVKEALKAIGRDETPEDRLAEIEKRLVKLREFRRQGLEVIARNGGIDQLEAERERLQRQLNADAVRVSEQAAARQAEQQKIKEGTKAFQDGIAAIELAGAQKRLAGLEASLDLEVAAVERADAKGLLSAEAKALKLNAIEQRRLQAQAALLKRQTEIERGRVVETPEANLAKQAAVTQLEAQLVQVQARIRGAVIGAQTIVDAAALERSREQASEWEQIWRRANDKVQDYADQQAASAADSGNDPVARAERAAQARVAAARREFAALEREIRNAIDTNSDPGQRSELQLQLDRLKAEGAEAIAEQERLARLASVVQQLAEQMDALRLAEAAIDAEVARGAATVEAAEQRKFDARDKALPQLQALAAAQRLLVATPAENNQADQTTADLRNLADRTLEVSRLMRGEVKSGFADFLTDFATGVKSAGDAFQGFIVGVARAALNVINQRLGEQLAASLFPAGGSSGGSGGGWLSAIGSFIGTLFHAGGVVGAGATRMTRAVSPLAFAGAQVLHGGGIAGLAPNEQPAILMRGEEVLTENDPRHVNNFRAGPVVGNLSLTFDLGGGAPSSQDLAMADGIGRLVRVAVSDVLQDEMRPGGLLYGR